MPQDPHRPCKCKRVNPGAIEMARREFLKRSLVAEMAWVLANHFG